MQPLTTIQSSPWAAIRPFAVAGFACIVGGGLLAAVTAHDPGQTGTWMVAYLVLVCGIAQLALGTGQALLANARLTFRVVAIELAVFNLGNLAVMAGTILESTILVDAGGALLAVALILFLREVRGTNGGLLVLLYRLLIGIVLVSIPIGLILART